MGQRSERSSKWRRYLAALLVATGACRGAPPAPAPRAPKTGRASPHGAKGEPRWEVAAPGLGIRLSNADPVRVRDREPPRVELLTEAQASRVLSALPPLEPPSTTRFALREPSLPVPRPGRTLSTPFPARVAPARPASAADDESIAAGLTVLRRAPQGAVALAPLLHVTFSRPMVPLTSHEDAIALGVPVELEPSPPGAWRWLGTRTLLFQPEGRFPMATEYRARVPSGTLSATGQRTASELAWSFSTPPPTVVGWRPGPNATHVELEPLIYLGFDQRIDPRAVLAKTELRAKGREIGLRLAEPSEIMEDAGTRALAQGSLGERWLVVRPTDELPKDSLINLKVEQGTPSLEGPLRTRIDQQLSFRTYGPLRVEKLQCSWQRECPPDAPWGLELNNDLDLEAFDPSWISVEPSIARLQVQAQGRGVSIYGRSEGRRTYRVTVSGELRDVFGQTLGKPVTRTVEVDSARARLFWDYRDLIVLDPTVPPTLTAYSTNQPRLIQQVYRVVPSDFARFQEFRRGLRQQGLRMGPPGRLVATRVLVPGGKPDDLTSMDIDLSEYLKDGLGQVVLVLKATRAPPGQGRVPDRVTSWVQGTRIGLHAFGDETRVHAWATDLATGAPLEGVEVSVLPGAAVAHTGADGIGRLQLPDTKESTLLVARKDRDLAFLVGGGSLARRVPQDVARWFVFDDGGLYQPGETVHAKGWVRRAGMGLGGDVKPWPDAQRTRVKYLASGPRGSEIARGTVKLDDSGGFFLSFELPRNADLGEARIGLELESAAAPKGMRGYVHPLQIGEYRRPEYEVELSLGEEPYLVGKSTVVMAKASYYTGGPLSDAPVRWKVSARPAHYAPPNWGGYHFGQPSWGLQWEPSPANPAEPVEWTARADAEGKHRLRLDFDPVDPAYPRQVEIEAAIRDVNTQIWAATRQLVVHPARATVGMRSVERRVKAGEEFSVELIVTDLGGKVLPGLGVTVTSVAPKWEGVGTKRRRTESDRAGCHFESGSAPRTCRMAAREPGLHEVTAAVRDAAGRRSESKITVWLPGADARPPLHAGSAEARLLSDRAEYRPGDTAEILILAPFAPAEGVLTLRRQGLVDLRRFRLTEPAGTLRVKIEPDFLPNITARVDLLGSVARTDSDGQPNPSLPKHPAFASGSIELKVPPALRTLQVAIAPRPSHAAPGSTVAVDLSLSDAGGQPVRNGRLALVVVDEALLALAGYDLPDPLAVFYPETAGGVVDLGSRWSLAVLADPMRSPPRYGTLSEASLTKFEDISDTIAFVKTSKSTMRAAASHSYAYSEPPGPGLPQPQRAPERNPKRLRTDLSALAAFLPDLKTNGRGQVRAEFELPDSVTRYRVIAVAASGPQKFGRAESTITAKLPLMVRPSPPRFLNYGDRFSLPIVVQNRTPEPLEVSLAVRSANATLLGPSGQRLTVPSGDRVETLFAAAAALPGTARFQIGAASAAGGDAAEVELPVWTPATTEAFATYGELDDGSLLQPVSKPSGAVTEFGGLEVTTSSTALAGLTDGVLHLARSKYDTNEFLASRILGIAALRDVLQAFEAEDLPSPAELTRTVELDIQTLLARRTVEAWGTFDARSQPNPYVTVHVTHALVRAHQEGFAVPKWVLDQSLARRTGLDYLTRAYAPSARRAIRAYATRVRHLAGHRGTAGEARTLVKEAGGLEQMPVEALGWLLPVLAEDPESGMLAKQLRRHLENRVTETAAHAHFVTSYGDQGSLLMSSERRADAVILDALIATHPENDLVVKLANSLLAHRTQGRWLNTQENVFVLLALGRYFEQYEKITPSFVARSWLGPRFAGEHAFRGRSIDRQHLTIPMSELTKLPPGDTDVLLSKQGSGRLYYRLGLRYAPENLRPPPAEHGFTVARTYSAVDDPGDVVQAGDGRWRVRRGARVRSRIYLLAPAVRHHVALVDPLPAGFEAVNTQLAVTESLPGQPTLAEGLSRMLQQLSASGGLGLPGMAPLAQGLGKALHQGSPAAKIPGLGAAAQSAAILAQSHWYQHTNLRDDRAEAFSLRLPAGLYVFDYVSRATTAGQFVVPPPKAEEMYHPETFGRGEAAQVGVE